MKFKIAKAMIIAPASRTVQIWAVPLILLRKTTIDRPDSTPRPMNKYYVRHRAPLYL